MSLSRLALRLAVMETLAPYAQHTASAPIWPTQAMGNVYDSRIGVQPATEAAARAPAIAVFTDDAKIEALGSAQDVTMPGDAIETVNLAFEITVPQNVLIDGVAHLAIAAETDSLAEAMLDLTEQQIRAAIAQGRMAQPLSLVLVTINKIESRPWHDADTDQRLSARRLEMECRVRRSDDLLPAVAAILPTGSYGADVCTTILAVMREPAALQPLNEIRFAANLARAQGDAAAIDLKPEKTPPEGDLGGSVTLSS